jgi:hypothetical protein
MLADRFQQPSQAAASKRHPAQIHAGAAGADVMFNARAAEELALLEGSRQQRWVVRLIKVLMQKRWLPCGV